MRRFLIFLLSVVALAVPATSWEASTSGNLAINVTAGQAITAVGLSNNAFTGGAASGTVVGAISVTMSPASPAFSGSLSLSGTNASQFQIVGSNLETNGAVPAGTYSINIVATETGATGSPLTQAETVTGTTPGGDPTVGLLPSDRDAYTSWSIAGLTSVGGIPNRTTQCGRTISPIGGGANDTTNIQNAINACPAGEVVQLAAGNFTFTEGNFIELANGITVRGAGAGTTILGRNGDGAQLQPGQSNGSNAQPMIILGPMQWGTQWNIDGTNSPSPTINLTADAVQHQSTITLKCGGNCASILSVGQIVLLDEVSNGGWQTDPTGASSQVWAAPDWTVVWNKHNPSLGQDDFSSSQYPYTPGTYGDGYARLDRPTNELKQIASISGNTVTFNSPLMWGYRVAQTAQLTWMTITGNGNAPTPFTQYAGIENLSVMNGDNDSIEFIACAYCWAKGVENSVWSGRGFELLYCFRCELRQFYSHDAASSQPGGGAYAIGLDFFSTEDLIIDGISVKTNKVIVVRASGAGSVVAYNYMDDEFINYDETWIETGLNAGHMTGAHHVLFEGNYGVNLEGENTHGADKDITYFQNWARGVRYPFVNPQTGHTVNDFTSGGSNGPQRAADTNAYDYWYTYIGNVLGASGDMSGWTYQGDLTNGQKDIWAPGWGESDANGTWHDDSMTLNTSFAGVILRRGNWDWLTSSQRWDSGFTPVTIPNSFYTTSAPSFFGSNPWPWVNPTTGAVATLPAQARWLACQSTNTAPEYDPTGACIYSVSW